MGRENRTGVYEAAQQLSLTELFRVALRQLRLSMRTHTMAEVLDYDPATQLARVSVEILTVVADNSKAPSPSNPNPTFTQPPVILADIPVAWPRTSSGYLTFPLNEGDKGELHVQDRSIDAWLELGDAVDPIMAWTHSLADAVFHPHVFNSSDPISPATDQDAAVIEADQIKIGRGASDAAARVGDTTDGATAMNVWITAITSAVNNLTGAMPPIPEPTDFGVISSGSSKVEIE
jgi:hypothetical protein